MVLISRKGGVWLIACILPQEQPETESRTVHISYFLQKHKNANPLNINLLFLKISDMNQAMSDISWDVRPADILGVPQAIKGFDKPDFCEVFLIYPKRYQT